MIINRTILLGLIFLSNISFSYAQTTDTTKLGELPIFNLSEVVIKATSDKNILQTISNIDIQLRPINNSQDVLRLVPGLFIGQHAGGGKAEQLFLRGFDLDHGTDIAITVDGLPVNMVSHAHGQGYADLHFVIPEFIDHVDFNKGPYAADKGNFCTAGFVDFKTKDVLEHDFVKLEYGQYDSYRTVNGFNLLPKREKKQTLFFGSEASFSNGYFESPQHFTRFNGILKYSNELSANTLLKVSVTGFTSKWGASGQIPNRAYENGTIGFFGAIDNTEGGQTSRINTNLEVKHYFKNEASWNNQVNYSKYIFSLYSNFTFFKIDSINGDQIKQQENRDIVGYNGTYKKDVRIAGFKSEIKTGIQFRYDLTSNTELSRVKTSNILKFGDINELNAGFFYNQRVIFSKKWSFTTGLRYDLITNRYIDKLLDTVLLNKNGIICPKLNFDYQLSAKTQLYFYTGKGFHSNDTRVVVLDNEKKSLPAAYGSDLGAVFKLGKKMFIQTALWYLWLDQEFIYVGDEGVVEAGGQTRRYGIDFSLRNEVIKNLYADVDLSLAKPKAIGVASSESYLPLAPVFTSTGGLAYKKSKGWNVSLRYRYMANRPANEFNTVIAKGYFIVDANIQYSKSQWQSGISIQNVLNTKWKETQFDTDSKLQHENISVSEIHFTAGTPFFAKIFFNLVFL